MNQTSNCVTNRVASSHVATERSGWAPFPATMVGEVGGQSLAFPPAPITDEGRTHLGGQAPLFIPSDIVDGGQVTLGGQAPMFLPDVIADAGLVRLGGQSPTF